MSLPNILSMIDNTTAIFISVPIIIVSFYKIIKIIIVKENQKQITNTFESIVAKLSSPKESEKISAAIILRKFFDKKSPFGIGNTPLAQDTINVISSVLRIAKTSDFQKLLADSLRYAPSLKDADLQKTNLTNAVLGKENLDFSGADFYRANLTNTSFKDRNGKGVNLENSVFYEAILHNTNFSGCNLKGANFYNANFKNTNFTNCINIPMEIQEYINKQKQNHYDKKKKKIFISHPRIKTVKQEICFKFICDEAKKENFDLVLIEKFEEQNHAVLKRIKEKIDECSAIIIFNYKQFKVIEAEYRWWSQDESKKLQNTFLPSSWIYIETGMSVMKDLPLYVITDLDSKECILNTINEDDILNINNYEKESLEKITEDFKKWLTKIN